MKLLLHPLAMPIYTFALYLEIERQSFVVDYMSMIWLQITLLVSMICANMLPYRITEGKSPLTDFSSPIAARIVTAIALIISFGITTFAIMALQPNTKGAAFILVIYIIPTLLNIISGNAAAQLSPKMARIFVGKSNAAPPMFIGALSGFTIMIGYKTSADTFWPFVISLLMIALHATFRSADNDNTPSNHTAQLIWYAIGIAQAVVLMYLDF